MDKGSIVPTKYPPKHFDIKKDYPAYWEKYREFMVPDIIIKLIKELHSKKMIKIVED